MSIATITSSANQIDQTFPIAGQDNNTQGFRDNFSAIKTGLEAAGAALSTLDGNALKLDADNDFSAGSLQNGYTKNVKGAVINTSTSGVSGGLDVRTGDYFRVSLTADTTITFNHWETGTDPNFLHKKITLELRCGSGGPWNVTFSATGAITSIVVDDTSKYTSGHLVIAADKTTIVEAWASSASSPVFIKYIGQFEGL